MAHSAKVLQTIIALLITLGGGWMLGHELSLWRAASAARLWAAATGIVEQSHGRCDGWRKRGITCSIGGRYVYEVQGRRYLGDRFTFDDLEVGSRRTLDSLTRRFAPGTSVVVHYNPKDPSSAVLDLSNQFRTGKALLGGVGMIVGLVASVLLVRQGRRRRRTRAIRPEVDTSSERAQPREPDLNSSDDR